MSLGMMVTRLAWMAQRLVSSKRPTRYASEASWSARTAERLEAEVGLRIVGMGTRLKFSQRKDSRGHTV